MEVLACSYVTSWNVFFGVYFPNGDVSHSSFWCPSFTNCTVINTFKMSDHRGSSIHPDTGLHSSSNRARQSESVPSPNSVSALPNQIASQTMRSLDSFLNFNLERTLRSQVQQKNTGIMLRIKIYKSQVFATQNEGRDSSSSSRLPTSAG